MVEPWYNSVGLEADQVKARQQATSSQRKNMTLDPRTSTPFEESNAGPVHYYISGVVCAGCHLLQTRSLEP